MFLVASRNRSHLLSEICRSCLVTKDEYPSVSTSGECTPRSDSQHEQHCDLVSGPSGSHYSTSYGINRRSSPMDVAQFSLFNGGLPHDFMHDVLEGVAVVEVSLLLYYCCHDKKYFTIDEFNKAPVNFDYEYTENDRPPPASRKYSAGSKLHLSASQSLLLVSN